MLVPTALLAALLSTAHAATYNEPWQEEVARQATALVKLRIVQGSETEARFERLEQLAGAPVAESGVIDRFRGTGITSGGDDHHGFRLRFQTGQVGYFYLLPTDEPGHWALATPSAGFAMVEGGAVTATFRHSYHQAKVPEPLYRDASRAIFQKLHGQPWDAAAQRAWMDPLLDQPPARIQGEADRFFAQHVALESCYHFCGAADLPRLEPFLQSEEGHVQISAARALSAVDSAAGRARLLAFVQDDSRLDFARVMAVWGLRRLDAREHAPALRAWLPKAPTERTGFGGNIMDPRVGTAFPETLKQAVEDLLRVWGA